jgi:hypothetical protein
MNTFQIVIKYTDKQLEQASDFGREWFVTDRNRIKIPKLTKARKEYLLYIERVTIRRDQFSKAMCLIDEYGLKFATAKETAILNLWQTE